MDSIFENYDEYGIAVMKENDKYFIRYETGGVGSYFEDLEVTKEDAEKAQISPEDAYTVVIKYQNRRAGLTQ